MMDGIPDRRLRAAQLAGAAAIGILGSFVVDMPSGAFGAAVHFTGAGAAYAVGLGVLAAAGVLLTLRAHRAASAVRLLLLGANIVFFLPGLATDPVIAGGIATFCIALLSRDVFSYRPRTRREVRDPAGSTRPGQGGPAVRHLLLVSLLATVVIAGYGISDRIEALLACTLLAVLSLGLSAPRLLRRLRAGRRWPLIPAAFVLAAVPAW
ncbi:MAG: hypothetical protein MUE73_22085, partial [Planctomycetes bacterium]|nr:hypothetical protein [Planctomycetota bacterium]